MHQTVQLELSEHLRPLLDVQSRWNQDNMSGEGPVDAEVEGRSEPVTTEKITKGINEMDSDTTAGSSSIVAEICEALRESLIRAKCLTSYRTSF